MEDFSNQNNPPSTPTGQTLGGGSVESLTPAEIRQRRLESLERQQQQTQQVDQQRQLLVEQQGQARLQASNVNIKTLSPDSKFPQAPQQQQQPAPSHHQPQQRPDPPPQQHQQQQAPTFPPAIVNDDEDEDLQAALALSLGDAATVDTVSESQNEDDDDAEDTPEHQLAAALRLSMEQDDPAQESSPSPPPTIPLFVQTQFAPHIQHSLETAEPTSILDFHYIMWDTTTTVHDQRRWLSQGIYFQNPHGTFRTDNLLASIISNHEVWGLTQTHGGPCGVLAAVQAELLRLLIFGPRRRNGLEYPTSLNHELAAMATDLSPQLLEEGLAKSISILLARASITPAANLHDPNNSGSGDNNHTNTTTTDYMTSHSNTHPTVQLVLPKENTNGLEWCHMEPWTSENGGSGMSEHLVTYTISAPPSTTTITNASSTPLKRPKIFAASDCGIEELAYATAQFLLETRAIDIFQRPGGILLMVMSLALSRRIPNVQGDMDDFTSKLTSNFGHCSQELINLLLTGQAGKRNYIMILWMLRDCLC